MSEPDYIIVGAGTAGSVLAGRLTEDGGRRVTLIEAGGKPANPFVAVPAGFARLFKSDHDWAFESAPQTASGRRVFIPRGRMLGGSSNMNAQIHQWCHPADFDEWAADGAEGWAWEDVAPLFVAQENWIGERANRPRGRGGPMQVAPNVNANPLSRAFVKAARANGLDGPDDYNGGAFEGAWIVQIAHKDGKRFSAYDAYLKPAMARPALDIVTEATVENLIFEGRRCAGVRFRRGGEVEERRAGGGVILAAGAFGSPQILMLSGVGPAAHLGATGVAVVHDLAGVGADLQDHPVVPITFATRRRDTLKSADSIPNLLRYMLQRKGPLASNAIEAFAFKRTRDRRPAPNLELMFAPLDWVDQALKKPNTHAFTIGPAVVKPQSRGTVRLQSPDARAAPVIDLGLLSDPEGHDAAVLLDGVRLARAIAASAPLESEIIAETAPGAAVVSDANLLEYVSRTIQTVYHPTSTCRIGAGRDGVVTPDLRVRGFDGLWVADASVMPSAPRGHPNAVVAMIAEHLARRLIAP